MRVLKNKNAVPPGGWRFFVKETEADLDSGNFDSLVSLVSSHMSVNNIVLDMPKEITLGMMIEDQICQNAPLSLSREFGSAIQYTSRKRKPVKNYGLGPRLGSNTLQRTVGFIQNARKFGTLRFVSQELALERAFKAIEDPSMVRNKGCYSCSDIGPISQAIGKKMTCPVDGELHTCGILRVYIRPLIHVDIKAFQPYFIGMDLTKLDDKFWLKDELIKLGENQ